VKPDLFTLDVRAAARVDEVALAVSLAAKVADRDPRGIDSLKDSISSC